MNKCDKAIAYFAEGLHCSQAVLATPEGVRFARENGLFKEFCPKMVASAVKVLESIMCTLSDSHQFFFSGIQM